MNFKKLIDKSIQNWPAKVISLILALILLQFHKNTLLGKRYFSVPLVCENTNGELVPAAVLPRMVKIALWGEANTIAPIREDDIIAYIDISNFTQEDEYRVPVQIRLKGTALNIEPLEIEATPAELKLRLENSFSKRINVKMNVTGRPAEGYEVYETGIEPASVEVKGPYSITENLKDLFTEPISIDGRKTNLSGVLNIENANALISFAGINKVQYTIKIRETVSTKTFENLPVHFENLDGEFEIVSEIPSGSITVKGSRLDLASWKPPQNIFTVNCSGITDEGTHSIPVKVITPSKVEIVKAEPINVKVEVKRKISEAE